MGDVIDDPSRWRHPEGGLIVADFTDDRRDFVPGDLPRDVLWGFTREGLFALRQYTHWMPHTKGLVGPFMAKYWPGLTFQVAMKLTSEAGVWTKERSHFSGRGVAKHVKELHLLAGGGSRIVRFEPDERVTTDPLRVGDGGITVSLHDIDPQAPGALRDIARALLGRLAPTSDNEETHP